jgi:hypothetical protein
MEGNPRTTQAHRCGGYILLIGLLVVVILGLILYYKSFIGHGIETDTGQELKNPPWRQWHNIQKYAARNGLGKPASEQPKITEPMVLSAQLLENQGERGTITLMFRPDYTIKGTWQGSYSVGPNKAREYELTICKFEGYLVPDETHADLEKRDNPAKIYFLSKGFFMLVEYNNENRKVDKISGDIYVSGWLIPDYTIQQGRVIITSDKKHFKSFDFSGKAGKMGMKSLESLFKS